MAYEWAKPGVKVVYKLVTGHKNAKVSRLQDGCVYTIREVFPHPTRVGTIGIRLVEVVNGINARGLERGYNAVNFRPLITREQDVEMFLRIASPSPLERLDRLAEELDSLYND